MLSKFISIGDKIELQAIGRSVKRSPEQPEKVYSSQVFDILSEDKIEIVMPMEKTKLILLSVDSEYELVLYGDTGLYQCNVRIVDRYKSHNVYILAVELISDLRKYQRREYYRFSCALEMNIRCLEPEEQLALENKEAFEPVEGIPFAKGVIVDISGGGLRFLSANKFDSDSLVAVNFYLTRNQERKRYEAIGRIISVKELENRSRTYEHRIQYLNMKREIRDEIIKYIFEAERKGMKKER